MALKPAMLCQADALRIPQIATTCMKSPPKMKSQGRSPGSCMGINSALVPLTDYHPREAENANSGAGM